MIANRGWWFLIVALSVLTLGAFGGRLTLTLPALTLLLWFLGEWLAFFIRVHWSLPQLRVLRQAFDDRDRVTTFWAGRSFGIRVEVRLPRGPRLPWLRIKDFVPFGAVRTSGDPVCDGSLSADEAILIEYRLAFASAGVVRFEGVAVEMCDFHGFFCWSGFVREPSVYRVLPPLADAAGHRPTVKRRNLLPAPGVHRHLRPGSGSELLDLRDYIVGDPPKTIAWKVSARRDRLITKEFESEVPLRCTLFVDVSQSVRVGPPGQNALARLVEISAAVGQATAGIRDLTGLCLFDENEVVRYVRPARGPRHIVETLNLLTDAAGLAPASGKAEIDAILPVAYDFAAEVYPDLLRPEVNSTPGWLSWFWPAAQLRQRRSFVAVLRRWLATALISLPFVILALFAYLLAPLFSEGQLTPVLVALIPVSPTMLVLLGVGLLGGAAVLYYALAWLPFRAVRRFFSPRARQGLRRRKSLAALLSERYGQGAGFTARLLEDDEAFALEVQRFLAEHQVPFRLPLYGKRGEYLFASPGKIDVLARALLRAVAHGRDNELFVLLVDLLDLGDRLGPLLSAIKVTLARHHRVLVICPWPPGTPPPPLRADAGDDRSASTLVAAGVTELTARRLQRAFHRLRRSFGKMGVPVVCAAAGDPVRLILARLNQLRSVGLGRR
jgi:uncharacterized protein (DUF58 family)